VFAVLITVLVLELRPPELPTLKALLLLWPTWLSYALSYLFIAIVWTSRHYLMRYAAEATPRLLWYNFAHFDVAASALYGLDGRKRIGAATGCLLCGSFLSRKRNLHMFDLGAY
jgi:Endosomal/lysosomal potassium channel TMEM175